MFIGFSFGGQKTKKHKQLLGIVRERVGVKSVYVLPFSWMKRETQFNLTHGRHLREISGKCGDSPGIVPGQSREIFVYSGL